MAAFVPDQELLRRFVAREEGRAFAMLMERHWRLVFGTCMRLLRRREDAEDAAQAVWIRMARKAPRLRGTNALRTWLYHTALWKAKNILAARRARARHEQAATEGEWAGLSRGRNGVAVTNGIHAIEERDDLCSVVHDQIRSFFEVLGL